MWSWDIVSDAVLMILVIAQIITLFVENYELKKVNRKLLIENYDLKIRHNEIRKLEELEDL